jgi:hypothetical protein
MVARTRPAIAHGVTAPAKALVAETGRQLQQRQAGGDIPSRGDRAVRAADECAGSARAGRSGLQSGKHAEEGSGIDAGQSL